MACKESLSPSPLLSTDPFKVSVRAQSHTGRREGKPGAMLISLTASEQRKSSLCIKENKNLGAGAEHFQE